MEWKPCQICKRGRQALQRYPNEICTECENKAVTKDGEPIYFANTDVWGGCVGVVNKQRVNTNICYVNGIKCLAYEARFGGITVGIDVSQRKRMTNWKKKGRAIGKIMLVYWQAVESANAPHRKLERGEFKIT